MKQLLYFILCFLLLLAVGKPSPGQKTGKLPSVEAYYPFLKWLASPGLEGRETGSTGAAMAADYIAVEMRLAGLLPLYSSGSSDDESLSGFFQSVPLIRYSPAAGAIWFSSDKRNIPIQLEQGSDFTTEYAFRSLDLSCGLVCAGYGIRTETPEWNDYRDLEVRGKVVMIREGYPEPDNKTVSGQEAMQKLADSDGFDLAARSREAFMRGAVAVLVIPEGFDPAAEMGKSADSPSGLPYQDAYYQPAGIKLPDQVPLLLLTTSGVQKFLKPARFRNVWPTGSHDAKAPARTKEERITLKIEVVPQTINSFNVTGVLTGTDTTHCLVIGAHYDHLGIRGQVVYPGADDNASGVAGLLALASAWSRSGRTPPCNIVFAAWTAEEKGHHGSQTFVSSLDDPRKVKLYINMDMISRSESADSTRSKLSIGTRTADEYLRETVQKCNIQLDKPFQLDLWDVTGAHGSDYASFTAAGLPILTFNTGLHEDYHTPRDLPEAVDLDKMGRVLKLIDQIFRTLYPE